MFHKGIISKVAMKYKRIRQFLDFSEGPPLTSVWINPFTDVLSLNVSSYTCIISFVCV